MGGEKGRVGGEKGYNTLLYVKAALGPSLESYGHYVQDSGRRATSATRSLQPSPQSPL